MAAIAVLAVSSVSMASLAAADEPFLTVSGTVHCVDNAYTLTVPREKIQTGTTSYYFLDGASLSNATQIGNEQPLQAGQDATATWTPTTSGTHKLWMRGISNGSAITIGPTAVDVVDQAPEGASCAVDGASGAGIGGLFSSLSAD
ncbi:hypothetical protein AB0L63_02515 [Nocardia sp. NPDC051990]|uniref:hypothetical protein n=1 Tax=Nocardia sp. NPDC051990 TaxID=3155285 RepID=UPI00344A06FA